MTPAISIIVLNTVVILLLYCLAIKQLRITTMNQLAIVDLIAILLTVTIVGQKYAGTTITFAQIDMHWLTFTIISYCIVEIPFAVYALRRFPFK